MNNLKRSQRAFTLIELMIVVAIVAIIAAIAVPSYEQFLEEGRRGECQLFAYEVASRQELYINDQLVYGDINQIGMPSGNQSENGFCTAEVALIDGGDRYVVTVTMTPVDTECSPLTLDNTGLRGLSGALGDVAQCWR